MKVTFILGNGFDLRMGMKTRYMDMYDSYVNIKSDDEIITAFKETLKKDKPNKYTNWCDFESAMGKYAASFEDESQFVKCVRDFRKHLVEYLEIEEKKFKEYVSSYRRHDMACSDVISDAYSNFYKGQIPNVISRIYSLKDSKPIEYKFITFNYTRVIEQLLNCYYKHTHLFSENLPVHIHGQLGGDIVLGVDNLSQFTGVKYSTSKKIERAFVKPMYNKEYDTHRVDKAKQIISESDVICIYGLSLGITDKIWVDELANWLLSDLNHHLIYFQYSEEQYDVWSADEKMDEEDERKSKLLNAIFTDENDIEKVYDNVHIPVGFDIFDIHEKLQTNNKKALTASGPLPVGIH